MNFLYINKHVKKLFALSLLSIFFLATTAQSIDNIAGKSIDAAIADIALVMKDKIPGAVKLIGVGDVASFARETAAFNTALAAFLITEKNVRHIVLFQTNWLLRPLSDYLIGNSRLDTVVIDSLLKVSLGSTIYSTHEFRLFITWLKKYNIINPRKAVSLSGSSGPGNLIPVSYFLSAYVFPIDKEFAAILSKKWAATGYADSLAFRDIEIWYREKQKDAGAFNKHKDLMARCWEDIEYNNNVSNVHSIQQAMAMTSNDILIKLKELKEPAIYFAGNEMIAKSKILLNNVTVPSPGMLIQEKLKDGYYACITDFSDTATLNIFAHQINNFKLERVAGARQTKELSVKKDCFFMPADSIYLKSYIPEVIPPVAGITRTIVPDNSVVAPADALFVFRGLTSATILKRNR